MFDNVRKKISSFFSNKNKGIFALASVFIFAIFLCVISFVTKTNVVTYVTERILKELGIYTSEVKIDVIESSDYSSNTPGSWHIDKSAKWIGLGKAEVSFDVKSIMKTDGKYKDIILVLDISNSMSLEKLEVLKSELKKLVNYTLSDSNNRVSFISLNKDSNIELDFTNDKDLLFNNITNIIGDRFTNYNSALTKIDSLMSSYVKEDNRDVVVLFLTNAYPNLDETSQIGSYELLKDKYPYMKVNGIQYEMRQNVIKEISEITDSSYVANMSTLNNVLLSATVSPLEYEKFVISDYVDNNYFTVNSVDDISVSSGSVSLNDDGGEKKVVWNLGDNSFITGGSANMVIKLSLKEGSSGYIPLNKKTKVETKLKNESLNEVSDSDVLVLNNSYKVIYDTNTPGCSLSSIPDESYSPYQNVTIKNDELSCFGYIFKGWEIDKNDAKDIKIVNDDVFVMPNHNVVIRATWARQSIVKIMTGTVYEKPTLYKVLQDQSRTGSLVEEYRSYDDYDTIDRYGTERVYYYDYSTSSEKNDVLNMNNVIFAGHCWQIIRTTSTGGVKMIYNGEPTSSGKCSNDRENHIGYNGLSSVMLGDSLYYYGTSYNYDKTSKKFTLAGDKIQRKWDESVGSSLIGKYTCKNYLENGTCDTLYYVTSYQDSMFAKALTLDSNSHYSQFGQVAFNEKDNSLAYVGYMYNKEYESKTLDNSITPTYGFFGELIDKYNYRIISENTDFPYEFNETEKKWISTNHTDGSISVMEFSFNAFDQNYLSYDISSEAGDEAKIYVDGVLKETISGEKSSVINLGYLNPSSVIRVEYIKNDSLSSGNDNFKFGIVTKSWNSSKWFFGSDVEYIDGKYILKNAISFDLTTDYKKLNDYHYTCFDESTTVLGDNVTCSSVKYIYFADSNTPNYIELTNGIKIEDAVKEMLSSDDVNKNDSLIKIAIDAWYEKYLSNYDDSLEDVIFCNRRDVYALNGWNPNGGDVSRNLSFVYYNDSAGVIRMIDLSCPNETDKFSVSNPKAKLKYKVGLASAGEMTSRNDYTFNTGSAYWLSRPINYGYRTQNFASGTLVSSYGDIDYDRGDSVSDIGGVRPTISLKPDTGFTKGDGSMDNPYVVGE